MTPLQKSIEHWRRLANGHPGEDIGKQNCALCAAHPYSDCDGCPIAADSGPNCDGTPYYEAWKAKRDFGLGSPEFKRCAADMLKYMEGLL